jgi:hypothetical protein
MRSIGLDIHRDFAEVAIAEGGEVRSASMLVLLVAAILVQRRPRKIARDVSSARLTPVRAPTITSPG